MDYEILKIVIWERVIEYRGCREKSMQESWRILEDGGACVDVVGEEKQMSRCFAKESVSI